MVLAALACFGCRAEPRRASSAGSTCPTPLGGLRIGADAAAGVPADRPLAELKTHCASARVDTIQYVGYATQALRFDFRGGTIWGQQQLRDTDTLVWARPVDHWVAEGDSLRFADGRLIPRTVGALRAMEPHGVMRTFQGDDVDGAEVRLCRYPGLVFVFDALPAPADTTARPLAELSARDTARWSRIEQRRVTATPGRWCAPGGPS